MKWASLIKVGSRSDLFAQARDGNAELFTVFSDGAPCDDKPLAFEFFHELLVGNRVAFVFVFNAREENALDGSGGDFFSVLLEHGFGEEILDRENTKMRLDVFAVADTADRGDVKVGNVSNVFENHRFEIDIVASDEVFAL